MTLAVIAITLWWLSQDKGVPLWDAARHTLIALDMYDAMHAGHPFDAFDRWSTYPPLVHSLAIATTYIAGKSVAGPVIAQNLVFLPLLVLGCYQTGKLVYHSALAGALAAAFALGTPMIASQFHVFMLDGPLTAMVALFVWLILASRRFASLRWSALAGVAAGLGLLIKEPFMFFTFGIFFTSLLAGGWRNWRGLLVFAGAALIVAAPWYLSHLTDLRALATQTAGATSRPDDPTSPNLLVGDNYTWYLWMALNYQYLIPLSGLAAVGVGISLARLVRRLPTPSQLPELLIGGFLSFVAATWSMPHDPRYSLPAVVYLAVLGTGWIVRLQLTQRRVAVALFAALVVANTLGASFGVGSRVTAHVWTNSERPLLHQGEFTFFANDGYVFGEPTRDGEGRELMERLHDRGVKRIERWWGRDEGDPAVFSSEGVTLIAMNAGLEVERESTGTTAPGKVFIVHRPVTAGPRPCIRLRDGSGVWVLTSPPPNDIVPPCPEFLAR